MWGLAKLFDSAPRDMRDARRDSSGRFVADPPSRYTPEEVQTILNFGRLEGAPVTVAEIYRDLKRFGKLSAVRNKGS